MRRPHDTAEQKGIGLEFRSDLKAKQKLLSAARRCLDDERCYRFFDLLASISKLPADVKAGYLVDLESTGEYDAEEIAALKRLIVDGGAHAFKHLVDIVRGIRVQQEIDQMMA